MKRVWFCLPDNTVSFYGRGTAHGMPGLETLLPDWFPA